MSDPYIENLERNEHLPASRDQAPNCHFGALLSFFRSINHFYLQPQNDVKLNEFFYSHALAKRVSCECRRHVRCTDAFVWRRGETGRGRLLTNERVCAVAVAKAWPAIKDSFVGCSSGGQAGVP